MEYLYFFKMMVQTMCSVGKKFILFEILMIKLRCHFI